MLISGNRCPVHLFPVAVPGECPRHECLARLRCPAEATPDGAGLLLADRCTHCAFASSATGGAKARGPRRPFVVPGSFLAASSCVTCRPRHTLRPRFFRLGCPVSSLPINRLRQLPTPALAYALLFLPPAAQSNAAATGSARARGRCHSLRSLLPFGVPGIFLADKPAASATDPCTRLCSAVSATGSAEQRGRHRRRSHRSP